MEVRDTIVANATPPGRGGVGIVRVSGEKALSIGAALSGCSSLPIRTAHYCTFTARNNEPIDEGLLLAFKAPHSFTGEHVVEFQCHGSPMVMDALIQACLAEGARLARPGEFSERAFLNGKMDLAQAEAVADLIDAHSQTAARMALRSLQGDFSKAVSLLDEKIVYLRLYVEASIDFPEEEIDFLGDGKVSALLDEIFTLFNDLRAKTAQGALVREGFTVVIAGAPNAGKSTLINRLAGQDVAIVTDVAGTTRDVMRERILLSGIPVQVVDTAGLRESSDIVEQEGIRRAWQEVARADCVLHVQDVNATREHVLQDALQNALPENVPILQVFNKVDVCMQPPHPEGIAISAKTGEGMEQLTEAILHCIGFQPLEGQFLARRRHLDALDKTHAHLESGKHALHHLRAGELLAEDLRLAHQALGEITGQCSADELLGKIFASFCIGK